MKFLIKKFSKSVLKKHNIKFVGKSTVLKKMNGCFLDRWTLKEILKSKKKLLNIFNIWIGKRRKRRRRNIKEKPEKGKQKGKPKSSK